METQDLIENNRRYTVGKHPAYDHHLAWNLARSLENEKDANDFFTTSGQQFSLHSVQDLEYLKTRYADKQEATIEKLKLLRAQKAQQKQAHINQGKRYKTQLTREELEIEADLDFLIIEEAWLDNRLKEAQAEEQKDEDQERLALMRRTPLGLVESINYNTGCGHVNYMEVAPINGDGIVCIVDKLSPYQGMSVLSYREFIIPLYRLEVNKIYEKKLKEWEENGKEGNPPNARTIKAKWPVWPKGVKDHLK